MHDIAQFLAGFKAFQKAYFCAEKNLFSGLVTGQNPKALVIACCDSRVDPALLMGCEPGDIFVARNVANLVPPYETAEGHHGVSAALEYGVTVLGVEHVIVLGHSSCGGIAALISDKRASLGEFIGPWVDIAQSALAGCDTTLAGKTEIVRQRACELAAILVSIDNLLSFPFIKSRVDAGTLYVHGWYFDMETGELFSYLPETKSFEVIVPRCESAVTGA